ncbi:MAG: HNH endonuclease [Peptostreptococcaceae bacterium]|nr:HNH endonuclease [Peptostreptococcaceae bacterium]
MEMKICKICKNEFKANLDNFYAEKRTKCGLQAICKKCYSNKSQKYRSTDGYKEKVAKLSHRYYLENEAKIKEYNKNYYIDNREVLIVNCKEYGFKNKEKRAIDAKIYRNKNSEIIAVKSHLKYLRNAKSISEKGKIYRIKNRVAIRKWKAQSEEVRRTRIKGGICNFTYKDWNKCISYFDNKCAYCGKELKLEKEHFVPVANSGDYTKNNIIPACRHCNSSKGSKSFFKWYPKFRHYSKKREKLILKYLDYDNEIQQMKII